MERVDGREGELIITGLNRSELPCGGALCRSRCFQTKA